MYARYIIILAAALGLQGCATLSKDECLYADWRMIGLEDGQNGRPSSRLGDHREACAEYGVTPDLEEYHTGYAIGIQSYCTFDRGYSIGIRGQRFDNPCPARLADVFVHGYRDGRDIYDHRQLIARHIRQAELDISDNELLIASKEQEIQKLNRKLAVNQGQLDAKDLAYRERLSLSRKRDDLHTLLEVKRDEMADLYRERDGLKAELEHLHYELDKLPTY